MLLDSNILIYAAQPEHSHLIDFIEANATAVSAISRIEVYGYPGLSTEDERKFDEFFLNLLAYDLDESIIAGAIHLRQSRNIKLGDSIIAATALCHDLTLVTRNTEDFDWIDGLKLVNPVDTLYWRCARGVRGSRAKGNCSNTLSSM